MKQKEQIIFRCQNPNCNPGGSPSLGNWGDGKFCQACLVKQNKKKHEKNRRESK
jgi:hypothetical protein